MYTPEEIRNIEFTKARGYKASEVDPFIDKCADTVEALIKEKEELTKKLEVLADKLVEYRNEEDSIRSALLSAQRLGDTVVREANHKASLILEDANIKAEKITETARKNIQAEQEELQRVKREVAAFKNRLLTMYRQHLELIDVLPEETSEKKAAVTQEESEPAPADIQPVQEEPTAPLPEAGPFVPMAEPVVTAPAGTAEPMPEAPVNVVQTAQEQSAAPAFSLNIPELKEDDVEVTPVVPREIPNVEAVPAARPNPRFADLKFGEEYDITEDLQEGKGFFRRKK